MNKIKTIIGVLVLALGISSASLAAPGNVRFTVHNLSNNNDPSQGMVYSGGFPQRKFYSTNESQVCIFCHTPHNAKPAAPLWNKASLTAATTFKMYTSSRTLTSAARVVNAQPGATSLLCLSCHDGKTAINVLHNASGGVAAPAEYEAGSKLIDFGGGTLALQDLSEMGPTLASTNLGGTDADRYAGNDLTNDHPIGFSYTDAQSQSNNRLFPKAAVNSAIKFFGGSNNIECSSCHDPHVNYDAGPGANPALKPFLVMSNTGSALCLSCHNK